MVNSKGHDVTSPWKMPAAAWKEVGLRTWKQGAQDNISLVAAGVAFYGFLALVPLLGAVVLTYGIAADPNTVLSNMKSLTAVLPTDVAKLIGDQLMSIVQTSGSKKGLGLIVALAVALWGARNAATSIITALNIAYEEEETRSTVRVNLLALAITAGGVVMAVLALLAITALGYLEDLLPDLPQAVIAAGTVLSYALLLLGASAAAASLYRYGPDRRKAKWEWITPGSIFAAVVWLLLTFGFGFYVSRFGNYNKTYGTLATVVILVTWLYLSAYVFLFGAELNSELEHQTARDTTEGQPKPLGDRGAWSADHVAEGSEPQKPGGEDVSPPQHDEPRSWSPERTASPSSSRPRRDEPSTSKEYLGARITNRAGSVAGFEKVGIVSAALSTVGLSLLRKRGREGAGAALVVGAVGLSLLRRKR
ncbi:MAG: YihY/virulence factor BrkB family protein [Sphingomicrobium sp.]